MIQAPMSAYPSTMTMLPAYQQQVMQAPVRQNTHSQTPGYYYNYPTASSYLPANNAAKSQYNGVNIEIINPTGSALPAQNTNNIPATFVPIQPVVMPTAYPAMQPVVQQNQFQTPAQPVVEVPEQQVTQTPVTQTPVTQTPVTQAPVAQAPVVQKPVEVPAPVIQTPAQSTTAEVAPATTPVVQPAVAPDPSVAPEAFAGRLRTNDLEAQRIAIEEIAETVKSNETAGPILLDTQIFDALVEVINKDTSALEAPTPEVIKLRETPIEKLTEAEKVKAATPSELEKAEINKQYALYTIAYMQERLNSELEKRGSTALELKDLPHIENVITAAKENPNPMIRIGALAALSHIARPEYKADLTTIFELAKSDEDAIVKEAATKALESLNK